MRTAHEGAVNAATIVETLKFYINSGNFIIYNNYFGASVVRPILQGKVQSKPVSTFLIELWEKKTGRHPKLNWKLAGDERFRIQFAAELLLAVSDWGLRYDTKDVHAYVRSKITDENTFVVVNALFALSVKKDESDVPLLKNLISKSDLGIFSEAVRTLGHICHPDAERALEELARTEKSSDRKRYIEETRDKFYRSKGPEYYCPPQIGAHATGKNAKRTQPAPTVSAKDAKLVDETIAKLKELINRNKENEFFEFVAHDIPMRFHREKVSTKLMVRFYVELWERRMSRHPDLDWTIVASDEFRFVIARELLDQSSAGHLRYDTSGILAYLRSIASHDDEIVAGNALIALEINGKDSEIPLLKQQASHADMREFKIAIRMLAGVCLSEAKQALEELIKSERSDTRKRYIQQAMRDFYDPDSRFFNCRH